MRHHTRVIAALAGLALLAACGADRSSVVSQPSPATSAAAEQTSTAPEAARTTEADPPTAGPQPTAAATATSAPAAATSLPLITVSGAPIALKPIAAGLRSPVYITHAGDGSERLFAVEKRGTIAILRDGAVADQRFLDIADRVGSSGSEQGLLSVAFHPRYAENGYLFVDYTDKNGDTVISRFQAQADSADPSSEKVLLQIPQPYANHNGGLVLFGPDGYLYIGMGDGGSGGDPQGNGQNPKALLGKLLRIDVDHGDPYGIPPDNPWASGGEGRPEVWALGLRNPWRYSFDRATGDLYIADVGQGDYEEVDVWRAGSKGGANYGWNEMEGLHCYDGRDCDESAFVAPVAEYDHQFGCSITGGYVYRGAQFPRLQGAYFFGDYCSGRMWMLREASGSWERTEIMRTPLSISSFGEDQAGELYVVDLRGGLYQVIEAP